MKLANITRTIMVGC